jgi:hypothetical protein
LFEYGDTIRPASLPINLACRLDTVEDTRILYNPERFRQRPFEAVDRDAIKINTLSLARNSRAPARLNTVKQWIENCIRNHPNCQPPDQSLSHRPLPSRLIDVTQPGKPRLLIMDDFPSGAIKYATVSHRWRVEGMPKLLQANLNAMRDGIEVDCLPVVFQDAIELCFMLGVSYLWIDALCLIQDNESDCRSEIERMGDIYSYAYCNFSATAAAKLPSGLFVDSENPHHAAFPVAVARRNMHFDCYGYSDKAVTHLNEESLMKRGWVLQERLLSPRSIYFGRQLSWECTELLANELFPSGVPHEELVTWGQTVPFKLVRMLSHDPSLAGDHRYYLGPYSEREVLYGRWLRIASMYAACDLTFDQDVLPAISGLARRFTKALDDVYLAGLWRGDLISGLMWERVNGEKLSSAKNYPPAYRGKKLTHLCLRAYLLTRFKHHRGPGHRHMGGSRPGMAISGT